MKINFVLNRNCIITDMVSPGSNKEEIINEIIDTLYLDNNMNAETLTRETIISALLEREREQTTAIGEGFAFPHARIPGLKRVYIGLGISKKGLDFNSMDTKPTNFFVLTLVPPENPNALLKTRAAITRFMSMPHVKETMLGDSSIDKIWGLIEQSNIDIEYDIVASDIMRPQIGILNADTTLKQAAREFHRHHIDTLPVVDNENNFIREVSCYDLFSYGMPEFFSNLHNVSFVKHMDPFEKYFNVDDYLKISDLKKSRKASTIASDATLMEIIFEMTVKNQDLLYVLKNDKLEGVLDRYSIIDKILIAM